LNSAFFERVSADTSDTSIDSEFLLQQGSISMGPYQQCALTSTRGLQCKGYGPGGRIGDGTEIDRASFVDVVGLTSDVRSVSAGAGSTCAVTIAGGAKCWGNGVGGGVPNNYSLIPVDVPGATTGVQSVEVGESGTTCFLMTAGTVKCMGDNRWGTLGDGTQVGSETLVDVVGLGGPVASINSASETTCAVMKSGVLKCWGYVGFGKAGDGTWDGGNSDAPFWAAPTAIPGMTSIASVAGTYKTICAVNTDGGVKCWGNSERGTLGNGQNWGSNTPVQVTGLTSGVIALTGGTEHYCALLDTNEVKCWGRNTEGQLGLGGASGPVNVPTSVVGLSGTITAIAAGPYSTCALNSIGELRCWGSVPTLINGFTGVLTPVRTISPDANTMMHGWYPASFSPTYNFPLNVGLRLTTSESGYVTKVLFAKDPNNTGPHTGTVWDASGNVLAQKAYTNETPNGWQEVVFDTPVRITAGDTFTVGFSLDNHIFANRPDFPRQSSGPLTLSGQGGRYQYLWHSYILLFQIKRELISPTLLDNL
jgi:alpha-tubulin suppressor-like RCC1 family protein